MFPSAIHNQEGCNRKPEFSTDFYGAKFIAEFFGQREQKLIKVQIFCLITQLVN
jgi:hypothetical protein